MIEIKKQFLLTIVKCLFIKQMYYNSEDNLENSEMIQKACIKIQEHYQKLKRCLFNLLKYNINMIIILK